ncbi:STAS domain-containing protein [Terribacillus saccharophilus]|uniref:STAS domain-containing protein n=1 Tax=Terribacillus saccharophilus TaxID=361277 RepID=UPI003811F49A
MKDELKYIGDKIRANKEIIAESVIDFLDKNLKTELKILSFPDEKLHAFNAHLINNIGALLFVEEDRYEVQQNLLDWGKKAAEFTTHKNISLTATLQFVSSFRSVIWEVFTEELVQRHFAAITMLDVSKIIDPMLEKISFAIGAEYELYNKKMMDIAYSALEELSVPVVPIYEGVAVLPIIGEIDTYRAKLIMETALDQGNFLQLDCLIIDVSGVLMIDTMVADQIFNIVKTLKLSGITAIITGIRPEIAQTMVSLGLDFKSITTFSNLRQALLHLGYGKIRD